MFGAQPKAALEEPKRTMSEQKKKQASIAAFFSPQSKSAAAAAAAAVALTSSAKKTTSTAKPHTTAQQATQQSESDTTATSNTRARASKKRAKSADAPAGGTKRQRPVASPPATAAVASPTIAQPTTPPPADAAVVAGADIATVIAVDVSDCTNDASVPPAPVVDVFTTPPPTKRTKANGDTVATAGDGATVDDVATSLEPVLVPVPSAAPTTSPIQIASSDDDVFSGDDDTDGGPHVIGGPHAPAAALSTSAPVATAVVAPKRRGRPPKPKQPGAVATTKRNTRATVSATAASQTSAADDSAAATDAALKPSDKRTRAAKGKFEPAATDNKTGAAVATAVASPPSPPVVLDPLVQARIATYQQKIDELTQQCARFLQTPAASDAILREIYGVAVDLGLELPEHTSERVAVAVTALFAQLASSSTSAAATAPDAVTELAPELKQFIAQSVQGQGASLSSLSHALVKTLETAASATATSLVTTIDAGVRARVLVMLEMEIKMLAQRTNYGVRPARANVFEDTSAAALWVWEVGSVDKYFSDDAQRVIKRMRKHRKRLGVQLKSLARVVQLLHATPIDEVRVSAEEARVGKFVLAVESETQRAQDRERKELEKVHVAEQRRHQELEREQTRADEKRKRAEDEEAERALADKRKQSLVSYFRSIDKSSASGAAVVAATPVGDRTVPGDDVEAVSAASAVGDAALSSAERRKLRRSTAQRELMERMDAAVTFLVGDSTSNDGLLQVPTGDGTELMVATHDALRSGRKSTARVSGASGHWSSRRHRDAALGVMKLLQFHENYRPAYYGTFSTRSAVFRGGRRPLAHYSAFDYSVDSEEEWEEEEPGESLSDADSDVDESDDDLDYGDQWLAYEDEVDYMDGAADDDEDGNADADGSKREKKVPAQLEHRKRVRGAGRKKAAKPAKLEVQIVGPCDDPAEAATLWSAYTGELLCAPQFESPLLRRAREHDEARVRQQELEQQQQQQLIAAATEAAKAAAIADKLSDASVAVATATTAAAAVLLKTPVKTPQKRKLSAENARLTTPQLKTASTAPTAAAASATPPVKTGITAWLKSPAVVDLSGNAGPSAAAPVAMATDGAVVDLSAVESDA